MSNELNKFVRDLAEIRAMENVAKNAKLNQEILKGQEKHIKLEEERLEIEKKKILVLESEVRERESAERKREVIKEKRKKIRKDGVALDEILRGLSSLVQKDANTNKDAEFRILVLNELCKRSFDVFEKESVIFEDLEDLKFCSSITSFFHELTDVIHEKFGQADLKLVSDQFSQIDQFGFALSSLNSFSWWSGFQDAKHYPLEVADVHHETIPSMTAEELCQLSGEISNLALVLEKGPLNLKAMIEFDSEIHSKLAKREIDCYEMAAVSPYKLFKDPIFSKYCKSDFGFDLYLRNLKLLIENEGKQVAAFLQGLSKFNDEEVSLAEAEIAIKSLREQALGKFSAPIDAAIAAFEKRKTFFLSKYKPLYVGDVERVRIILDELSSEILKFNESGEIHRELIESRRSLIQLMVKEESSFFSDRAVQFCIAIFILILVIVWQLSRIS
jgi:hypothetical protein